MPVVSQPDEGLQRQCIICVCVQEEVHSAEGCAHQDGGRLDDLDGLGQGRGHGSQLVPDLR